MYISPELFYKDRDTITKKTDVFSLGLSIFQILTNLDLPKNGLQWQLIRTVGIPNDLLDKIPEFEGDNKIFKILIKSMTNYKSSERPDLENILKDKENYPIFFEKYQLALEGKYKSLIELDKLDSYYKKQIQNFTKKIENYEKGIYLNNNCYMNKRSKIYKPKHRLNSISPKRKTTNIIKHNKYSQLKTIEDETTFNNMKRTRSINNIFFQIKNNEIKNKINSNITSNLNINGGNLNLNQQQNNRLKSENIINSPKYIDNNIVSNYYDSIETDSIENKTINIAGTASNFRKKLNLKSNCRYNSNKERDKDKKIEKENIRKTQTKVSAKKVMKRINSNRTSLKIPKNIPNNINTSKYIHTKEKKIPKFTRYNSLKQLSNGKSRKNNTSTKENECFNKTFSRVEYMNNNNIATTRYNNNTNQSQRNSAKNFILNKITKVTIINGKTPVPIQRTQSKTRSIIK